MRTVSVPSVEEQVREIVKDPNAYVAMTRQQAKGRARRLRQAATGRFISMKPAMIKVVSKG